MRQRCGASPQLPLARRPFDGPLPRPKARHCIAARKRGRAGAAGRAAPPAGPLPPHLRRECPVEAVLVDDHRAAVVEAVHDAAAHGRLARGGPACPGMGQHSIGRVRLGGGGGGARARCMRPTRAPPCQPIRPPGAGPTGPPTGPPARRARRPRPPDTPIMKACSRRRVRVPLLRGDPPLALTSLSARPSAASSAPRPSGRSGGELPSAALLPPVGVRGLPAPSRASPRSRMLSDMADAPPNAPPACVRCSYGRLATVQITQARRWIPVYAD